MCNYLSIVTVGTVNSASGDIVTLSTLLAGIVKLFSQPHTKNL